LPHQQEEKIVNRQSKACAREGGYSQYHSILLSCQKQAFSQQNIKKFTFLTFFPEL